MPGTLAISSFVSTPHHIGVVLTACAGDQISLTCSHDNVGIGVTRWVVSAPIDCSETVDHNPPISTDPCGPFTFQDVTEIPDDVLLNSTAVVIANASMSGGVVECRDGGGSIFNQIGNVTLCIIDQPNNLTVVNGALITWTGSACGSAVTYRVEVTYRESILGNVTTTANTVNVADIPNLRLNQDYMYNVSVTAVGKSCSSDPSTILGNFTTQNIEITTSKHLGIMYLIMSWQKYDHKYLHSFPSHKQYYIY